MRKIDIEFMKAKMHYDHAKSRLIIELIWVIGLLTFLIGGFNPFGDFASHPWGNILLVIGIIFWGICLYGSIRSIVKYRYR